MTTGQIVLSVLAAAGYIAFAAVVVYGCIPVRKIPR